MKSVKSALLLAALASTIVSCSSKDEDNDQITNGLEGEYTFVDLKAETYAKVISTYAGTSELDSSVTTSAYKSTKTSGTVSINATNFVSNKVAYSISGTMKSKFYPGGKEDSDLDIELPLNMDLPEANGNSVYKLIGTDSIYLSSGSLSSPILDGGSTPTQPNGAKYKWSGDTLVMTSYLDVTSQATADGQTDRKIQRATVVTRLKKK